MAEPPSRTVTLLFSDVEGSTRLLETLGADRYRTALEDHRRLVREAIASAGGSEIDAQGDSFFVAFERAEDGAQAAVRMQRNLAHHEWPAGAAVRIRIGMHSTAARESEGRYVGIGVHRAARICNAGHGGQVLVSSATAELLRDADVRVELVDLGIHRLKDIAEPEHLFQLAADGLADRFPPLRSVHGRPASLRHQPTPPIGRDAEVAQIREFLTGATQRMGALHLHGAAGIGKSTLWRVALDEAAERGFRVISTRPSEAEAQLPFTALNDLFGELLDDVSPNLPAPQRTALDLALLRRDAAGEAAPEPLALSLATLHLVQAATVNGPLAVAIDDVQWLDAASVSVLDFIVRRLDAEPVALIWAERRSDEGVSTQLVRQVPVERRRELHVGPMTSREIGRLLASAIGLELPPSSMSRIAALSGGNAFYAVEVGRAMQRRGLTRLEEDVSLPSSLTELVADRLDDLSPAGEVVVGFASALSEPSARTLEAVLGHEAAAVGVADAVDGDILERSDSLLRFTHPLLAAAAYARMDGATRRDVHRQLAEVVTEVEERATHLDLSSAADDELIAAVLDEAAIRANERGAPEAAADFAERAARRTSGGEMLTRRQIAAAGYRLRAGDMALAREWLEAALAHALPGPLRAEALMRLGEVRLLSDDWGAAEHLLDQALDEPDLGQDLLIEAMVRRAGICHETFRHRARGMDLITEAFRLAQASGDPTLLARVLGPYATWQWEAGHHDEVDTVVRLAAGLGAAGDHLRVFDHVDTELAAIASQRGDHNRALALWARQIARATERGDYSSLPLLLLRQTRDDFLSGRADDALAHSAEAETMARITRQGAALQGGHATRAIVNARIGRPDAAWAAADAAIAQGSEIGLTGVSDLDVREELATMEISRGHYEQALDALGPELLFDADVEAVDFTLPTRAEALVRLGRVDEAEAVLKRFEAQAAGNQFTYYSIDRDAGVGRVSALLAASRGDLEEATRLIEGALDRYAQSSDPWSRGRALLVAADIHRRSRRRAQARAAASEARALFERYGGVLWTERATELLARVGAAHDDSTVLTTTQSEVAQLAIEGLTNRQIGERLFMSVHTVEAHLTAAYRALGIGSRRELAGALRDPAQGAGSLTRTARGLDPGDRGRPAQDGRQ